MRRPRNGILIAVCVCGAFASGSGDGGPATISRFGYDGLEADAHTEYGKILGRSDGMAAHSGSGSFAEAAGRCLLRAHAFRLQGRFGLGYAFGRSPSLGAGETGGGPTAGSSIQDWGWSEASIRLPFRAPEAEDGIQAGLLPLPWNPDAALFGNYLARRAPYLASEARGMRGWDSLGTLAPRVETIRMALGRGGGPLRIEGGLVREGRDYSWFGFLSGATPWKASWGLGVFDYRAIAGGSGSPSPYRDLIFIGDTADSAGRDTVSYSLISPMVAARAAIDFAAFFGEGAPEERYGGLFAEAALLGWRDIPIDPDRGRRIVWTLGARLPAFGWLDVCTLQWEWRSTSAGALIGRMADGTWQTAETPRRPSPWSIGMLLSKGIGAGFTVQARALTYEEANPDGFFSVGSERSDPERRFEGSGRIVFRWP